MTVDELGNIVPFVDNDGKNIKDMYSSPEHMESIILAFLQSQDFQAWVTNMNRDAPATMGTLGILDSLTDTRHLSMSNNGPEFSVSYPMSQLDPDELNKYLDVARYAYFNTEMNFGWPPNFSTAMKVKLLNWMKQISYYGSYPHHQYLNGYTFSGPDRINASEIYPELVSSLIWGAGAARIPMPADVKQSVISILNWLYKGDGWKSRMPQVSLEALGVN